MLVSEWQCLIPKSTGFFEFLLELQELYPTVCDEIEDAFTAQLQTIPPAEWGANEYVRRRQNQELDFSLPDLMLDIIVNQAPCLCRTKHENVYGFPKGLHTLPLLHYLKDWPVKVYLRAVAHVDNSTGLEETTAFTARR
jgi:hypothetical protein